MGLIEISNGKPATTSRAIAAKFEKTHKHVLVAIRSIIDDYPEEFTQSNFGLRDFVTDKGNTYQEFILTRDAFTILAMGFTGKPAIKWKLQFLAAFNAMESKLNKADDAIQWKAARLQGKSVRKATTDAIHDFVEYATKQGSKNARMYYANITKMEYKALDMLEQSKSITSNFRDSLDLPDLCMLLDAENIARMALAHGMDQEWHYKDIYTFAKDKVIARCESARWATTSIKIENKGMK